MAPREICHAPDSFVDSADSPFRVWGFGV
jgi:hypothetical protein